VFILLSYRGIKRNSVSLVCISNCTCSIYLLIWRRHTVIITTLADYCRSGNNVPQ